MKRLIESLAVVGLGLFLGMVPGGVAHAATATTSSESADSSTTSSPQAKPKAQPKQPVTYRKVFGKQTVNYYTKIGTNRKHNYQVYQTGGAKSSAKNMKAISTGRYYANKKVHVTREEKMGDGTWLKFTYQHTQTGWIHRNGTVKSYRWLNVPLIAQRPELPTGCEITATTMMLQYAGAKVSKMSLAKEMPRSSNPNKGFVGSPYRRSGWWIYPKGLMKTVKHHIGSAKNMTGASFKQMKAQINQGHPVVIWVAGVDGFVNHAITLSGYSSTRAYYNDPWTKRKTSMTLASLHKHRKHDAYRALSY
ncbi:C39 family peptidase [Levilactobacillus tongjiangensis]|uniref:C39 family peptidase n=1 Tax=Levilactobacillus tongjiangensis TaxID=2486023 RepID=A0ABW1SVJ4_9LACO|nr:C39 family peptidase [Levilactobacillus tongjiangensis]